MVFWFTIFLAFGLFLIGILLLSWSADKLIDSLEDLSKILKAPSMIIGAIFLSIDLEETLASVSAAQANLTEIAIGNVLGNTIMAITFIFALPGLFHKTKISSSQKWLVLLAFGMSGILFLGLIIPTLSLLCAFIEIIVFIGFYGYNIFQAVKSYQNKRELNLNENQLSKSDEENEFNTIILVEKELDKIGEIAIDKFENKNDDDNDDENKTLSKIILLIIVGILGTYFGAEILIYGLNQILNLTNWSQSFFGVIIIASATNIEEYALLFQSIKRKAFDIGLGGFVGKIIWNLGITYGLSILISQIVQTPLDFSITLLINSMLLTIVIFPIFTYIIKIKQQLNRPVSIILIIIYVIFLIYNITNI